MDSMVESGVRGRLHEFPVFDEVVEIFETELGKALEAVTPFKALPPFSHMLKIIELVRAQLGRI